MASGNQWAFDIETNVFSKIYAQLHEKYPKALITRDEQSSTTPTFPTILIQALEPVERNPDLETQINSVLFSAQITVTANKSRSEAECLIVEKKISCGKLPSGQDEHSIGTTDYKEQQCSYFFTYF